jgi:hypothetical protein
MTGLVIWLVSIEAPAPSVIKVTEPSTPTFQPAGAIEARKRRRRHEHNDDGSRLRAQLEAERRRDQIIVPDRPAADEKRALAIFTANSKSRLDHCGEHQDPGGTVGELARARRLTEELVEAGADIGIDLGGGSLGSRSHKRDRGESDKCKTNNSLNRLHLMIPDSK